MFNITIPSQPAPPRLYEEFLKFMYSGASKRFRPSNGNRLDANSFPSGRNGWKLKQVRRTRPGCVRHSFRWTNGRKPVIRSTAPYSTPSCLVPCVLAKPAIDRTPIFHASSHAIRTHDRLREIVSMPRRQMTQMSNITAAQYRFGAPEAKHRFALQSEHFFQTP